MNNELKEYKTQESQKGSKIKIIFFAFLILILVILALSNLVSFIYCKFFYTAEDFLDDSKQNINTRLTEMFNDKELNYPDFNIDIPYQMKYDFNFTSNMNEYQDLTNLNFMLDSYIDFKNSLEYSNLVINNGDESLFNGDFYIDENVNYFNIPDIYPKTLYSINENNLWVSDLNLVSLSWEKIAFKLLDSIIETLKETDSSSINKWFTIVYKYEINADNNELIKENLIQLIESDSELNSFFNQIYNENWQDNLDVPNLTISFEINIFSKDIVSFNLITSENSFTGKRINDNKFRITDTNNNSLDIDYFADKVTFTYNLASGISNQFNFKKTTNGWVLEALLDNIKFTVNSEVIDSSLITNFNVDLGDFTMMVDSTCNLTNNEIIGSGSVEFSTNGATFGLEYNLTFISGVVVPIKTYENALLVDELTDEDYNLIQENLMILLNKIPKNPLTDFLNIFMYSNYDYSYENYEMGI